MVRPIVRNKCHIDTPAGITCHRVDGYRIARPGFFMGVLVGIGIATMAVSNLFNRDVAIGAKAHNHASLRYHHQG